MTKFSSFNANSVKHTSLSMLLIATLGVSAPVTTTHAATKGYTNYISDSLEVPMRRAAGYKYKISRMLKSGEAVKILEVDKKGWAQVQYKKAGKTYIGWLPSIVLQNQPVAKDRLAIQIKKTTDIEEKFNALQQELSTLKTRYEDTDSQLSTIKQEKFEIGKELERLKIISSNAVELDEQNQEMKMRLSQLENQNAIMKEQIDQSNDSLKRQWFITGGGVLLLGLIIGFFFRAPGKRKKWGEL
ncbi:TIGR04211 family SH3 domain-containing protein [Thiomicrorhabdus lithotrophica]|uniref:TIGR04211 family SH3 domain-containing protein n=1 Tax=Thiomicrorhabdus lithotrophica TaxID=2949997 RepID=A0ABY8CB67_9GAMM|nr:TIGR04211 family SH3 domain-containing protein [Thiomicrorhabdus lithotrophica]WEJ63221.1 TIGR04211 family SH3 domain-containing protein [Thiomicrorhabdus lithotrophica]